MGETSAQSSTIVSGVLGYGCSVRSVALLCSYFNPFFSSDEFGVKTVATAPSTQSRIPLEDINEDNNRFFSKNQNMEREEHGSNTDKEQDDNE